MNLEQVMRLGFTAIVWLVVAVLMSIFGIINLFWSVPALISWLFIGFGVFGTVFLWNETTWQRLRQTKVIELEEKITYELSQLSDKDVAEAKKGLHEVRQKFGIQINIPLGEGKKKNEDNFDAILETLSVDELFDVREKLNSGEMDESEILDWLKETGKCGSSRKLKHG